jgi:beta-1,4-mannosyl-glycoprotein beta-1,4-N-acetylglucosaminyltransferase
LIGYDEFFNIGKIIDCYNNILSNKEHNQYVLNVLNNAHLNLHWFPQSHIKFLDKLFLEFNPDNMIIYDIGSSVLHWTQNAKNIWKNSQIYLFDGMTEMKLFYDEYNNKNNTTYEYNVGVLCDEDYKRISFYQSDEFSGGNSYYKEIGHRDSDKIFTEKNIKQKIGMKLETIVKIKNIPAPDLIKIDVQGAELDILKGSMELINNAKFIIVELQHTEYNKGAPLCNQTRDFLIENGWEVYAEKFSNNGPDADWCFINKNYKGNNMNNSDFKFKNIYNNKYNTSKVESEYDATNLMLQFGKLSNTDKVTHHEYHKYYEPVLKPYYNSRGSIIEIGLGTGVSLPMWKNLFKYAHIYGIDNEYENNNIDRCTIYKGDQSNEEDLNRLKHLLSDKNVFFINDDGSHIPEHQLLTFNTLFPILAEGGIYIIEDIEASYWTRGECYNYKTQYGYKHPNSIVEIFKDATDIMNREFIVDKTKLPNKILHSEYIESVTFARNCIIIKKNYNSTREYRFKMFTTIQTQPKIIDCFTFYNELDMLTYRLNILNDVVDFFVLVEAMHTHVGKVKPLFYQENKHLFEKFNHKIIHIIVDDFPHKYPNINIEKEEQWINEKFQRNCISRGINKLSLQNNDIITITDLDEIPNPKVLKLIKNNSIEVSINILEMDLYYYNLHSKLDHFWHHSKLLTFEKYNELNIECDKIRFFSCPIIKNAGWHLSYFGDEKFIKNKIENFGHQELNIDLFTNQEKIQNRIKNTHDLFDRPIKLIYINIEDNDNLPPEYDVYLIDFYSHDQREISLSYLANKCGTEENIKSINIYDNKLCIIQTKNNSVYVDGIAGLGNSLFQIATAISYKEKYNTNILLKSDSYKLRYGTSNLFNRTKQKKDKNSNEDITYDKTIFSKFEYYDTRNNSAIECANDYTSNIVIPSTDIIIKGYCQNVELFKDYIHKIPEYLHLDDATIIDCIKTKYKNTENGVMIGVRIGEDFKHMNKLTRNSYINALETLKNMDVNIDNLFIISDIDNAWEIFNLHELYPATQVNEDDITQIYIGRMCSHFILSESTFHLWIAYLSNTANKNVVVFNNTDITNRNLCLDGWIHVDY